MSTFTNNIAMIKATCGLTANRIAKMAGFPASTMMRIQSDEHAPQMKTVEAIANAIGLNAYELLFVELDRVHVLDGYRKAMGLPPITVDAPTKEQLEYAKASYEEENVLKEQVFFSKDTIEKAFAMKLTPLFPHVVGSLCVRCQSDDLAPRITRGYNLYVKPIDRARALGLASDSLVMGYYEDSGFVHAIYGQLIASEGVVKIKPLKPNSDFAYECDGEHIDVVGVIVGWTYFQDEKTTPKSLPDAPVGAPCSPAEFEAERPEASQPSPQPHLP